MAKDEKKDAVKAAKKPAAKKAPAKKEDAKGGRRGAMISGFVYGFELIFLSGFTYKLFDHFASVGAEGTGHDCIDAMAVMVAMKNVWVGIAIIVAAFVVASVIAVRRQKAKKQ